MNFIKRHAFLFSVFFIGFASLLYQTYAIHVVFQFFPKGSDMVALSVAAFLSGLGLSALLFSKLSENNIERAKKIIIFSQVLLAFLAYVFYRDLGLFEAAIKSIETSSFSDFIQNFLMFGLIWIYLFIPAMLLGGCFPVIIGLHQKHFDKRFEDSGNVYFYDILGAVFGSLVTGFYLIPYLGLEVTVYIAVLTSIIAISFLLISKNQLLVAFLSMAFLTVLFVFSATPSTVTKTDIKQATESSGHPEESLSIQDIGNDDKFGKIVFRKPSHYGTVTVGDYNGISKKLFINHRKMCVTKYKESKTFNADGEHLLALMALSNIKAPGEVVNVGLGCGLTATLVANHPNTKKFDLVEINPVIVHSYNEQFAPITGNIFDLDHVTLHVEDGAKYIRKTKRKFDVIIIDIEEIDVIHSLPLYTQEYFQIMKERLKPDGVLALWSFYVNDDFSKVLYNGLKSVFPHVEFVPRADSRGVAFFAADKKIETDFVIIDDPTEKVDISSLKDHVTIKRVLEHPNNEINTLNNPVLRKYYNSYKFFQTPDDYIDPQVIRDPVSK